MINWEAAGAIGELVAAVGVIVTLIYLARQIRQSTIDARAEANMQLGTDYAHHQSTVMSDENVGAFVKGLESYGTLSPQDRAKFDMCMAGYVNMVEATLMLNAAGRAYEELDMQQRYLSNRLFSYPGFEDWWHHGKKGGFARETQTWVDRQIEANRGGPRFWHQSIPTSG